MSTVLTIFATWFVLATVFTVVLVTGALLRDKRHARRDLDAELRDLTEQDCT